MKILILFVISAIAFSVHGSDRGNERDRVMAVLQSHIDVETSAIRSPVDLERVVANIETSALSLIPQDQREDFIKGLVFTSAGLGSYSIEPLQGMKVSEAYEVLKLFGMQSHTTQIAGLAVVDELDDAILAAKPAQSLALVGRECRFVWDPSPRYRCVVASMEMCDGSTCM